MRANGRQPTKLPKVLGVSKARRDDTLDTVEPIQEKKPILLERVEDTNWTYSVKYVHVDSRSVINMCGPEFLYRPTDWTDSTELARRLDVGYQYVQAMNSNLSFFTRLEASILKSGFKNPILLTSGYPKFKSIDDIPPFLLVPIDQMLVCESIGGSRLLIAQKHGLKIPALVTDFTNAFPNERTLDTVEQITQYYQDKPKHISFSNRGLCTSRPIYTHMPIGFQEPSTIRKTRNSILKNI